MNQPATTVIRQRFSCRRYDERPMEEDMLRDFRDFLAKDVSGPFGSPVRFTLAAATEEDRRSLKGLGTYGFIRGATGFIIGAVKRGPRDMEDFGYLMEEAILFATDLGLGTCWLGGTFTKSAFAKKIGRADGETVPAVTSVGYCLTAAGAGSGQTSGHRRLPAEQLFFEAEFGRPLVPARLGEYATPLEMVRLAPSASNKQPWRIVRDGDLWHFYLQRTKGYGKGSLIYRLLGLADLQRVDMGIAMCHFELSARELGLPGRWVAEDPAIVTPAGESVEYIVSWAAETD